MSTIAHSGRCAIWLAQALEEPQWINCDIRKFDMNVLGKFGVIMTDPPWEIHQDLPYGTMGDEEMRRLNIGCLQDDGVIFVWVTGEWLPISPPLRCLQRFQDHVAATFHRTPKYFYGSGQSPPETKC